MGLHTGILSKGRKNKDSGEERENTGRKKEQEPSAETEKKFRLGALFKKEAHQRENAPKSLTDSLEEGKKEREKPQRQAASKSAESERESDKKFRLGDLFKKTDQPAVQTVSASHDEDRKMNGLLALFSRASGGGPVGRSQQIFQTDNWSCGPTSAAMAIDPFTSKRSPELAAEFKRDQGGGGMSWSSPHEWAREYGCSIRQLSKGQFSAERLASHIRSGGTAMLSVGDKSEPGVSPLTTGGHIICIDQVRTRGGDYVFRNLDPNYNNIRRGYGEVTGDFLENRAEVKQAWFISEGHQSRAQLADSRTPDRRDRSRVG